MRSGKEWSGGWSWLSVTTSYSDAQAPALALQVMDAVQAFATCVGRYLASSLTNHCRPFAAVFVPRLQSWIIHITSAAR